MAAALTLALSGLAAVYASPESGTSPKARALEVYVAFKNKNWNRLFDLAAMDGITADNREAARKAFVDGIDASLESNAKGKSDFDTLVSNMSNVKTGAAVVKGNHATVPTSSVVKIQGKALSLTGRVVLLKQGAEWKWDLTGGDKQNIEKVSAEVFIIKPPVAK